MDNARLFFSFSVYNETVLCLTSKALSTPGKLLGDCGGWGGGRGGEGSCCQSFPFSFSFPFIISKRFFHALEWNAGPSLG